MDTIYLDALAELATTQEDYYRDSHAQGYCCNAIKYFCEKNVPFFKRVTAVIAFTDYFLPTEEDTYIYRDANTTAWYGSVTDEHQNERILALLFMHQIINDKDQERYL